MKPKSVKIIWLRKALRELDVISREIQYKRCIQGRDFSSGLIAFRPLKSPDPKQIRHRDKDVICHVLRGRGRLRINGRRVALEPGMICHIPKGTPHDFAAGKKGKLVLLYSLIKTG